MTELLVGNTTEALCVGGTTGRDADCQPPEQGEEQNPGDESRGSRQHCSHGALLHQDGAPVLVTGCLGGSTVV